VYSKNEGKALLPPKQTRELDTVAKANKAVAEKKEFAWDSEVKIGGYEVGNKERHEVKICTLNDKQFVVDTKIVMKATTDWVPVKNTSIPLDNFHRLTDIVNTWKPTRKTKGDK
jgi:hypothetical protein